VTDQTGAIVAGASVRLLNEANGVIAQTATDSNGVYSFSELSPGQNYRVEVEHQGFQKSLTTNVNIVPGSQNQLTSQLQVGSSTQTVMVTADTSSLQTDSGIQGSAGRLPVARRPHVGTGIGVGAGIGAGAGGGVGGGYVAGLAPGTVSASLASMYAAATGQELGDLFEYKLKDKVTLKKNQSAWHRLRRPRSRLRKYRSGTA
jgi:hypothetical protein